MPVYPLTAWKPSCTSPGCWCRDRVPRYPSDLDDAQWAVLEPQARAVMAELAITAGRPRVHDLRAICGAKQDRVAGTAHGFPALGSGVCLLPAVERPGPAPDPGAPAAGEAAGAPGA